MEAAECVKLVHAIYKSHEEGKWVNLSDNPESKYLGKIVMVENKLPGKDVTQEDLESKFPLASKKSIDHKTTFDVAGVTFGGDMIPVFAGPNTVEDEEMIVNTAKAVKLSGAHFLKGAFKPLTFPYRGPKFFELREEGLKIVKDC